MGYMGGKKASVIIDEVDVVDGSYVLVGHPRSLRARLVIKVIR
jgi:hypothetical protein